MADAILYPKIVYNPGAGTVTLNFTYPPVAKPGADDLEATRHDSKSISGLLQIRTEVVEVFRNLQMDYVPIADMPAWAAFMLYAVAGMPFDLYMDATLGVFKRFTLVDTTWPPTYSMGHGTQIIAKWKMRLRLALGPDQTGS